MNELHRHAYVHTALTILFIEKPILWKKKTASPTISVLDLSFPFPGIARLTEVSEERISSLLIGWKVSSPAFSSRRLSALCTQKRIKTLPTSKTMWCNRRFLQGSGAWWSRRFRVDVIWGASSLGELNFDHKFTLFSFYCLGFVYVGICGHGTPCTCIVNWRKSP